MSDQLKIEVYNNIASGAPPIQVIETEISSSSIFVQPQEDVAPINVQVYESTTSGTFPIQVIQSEFTGVPIFVEVQEDYAPVQSVNGKIGWVTIDKNDVGLSNVENVSILEASGYLDNKITNLSNDVVYTTGYQEISGYKYFSEGLDSNYLAIFPYGSDNSSIISLFNKFGGIVDLSLDNFTDEFSIKLPGRNGTLLTDQDNRILFTSGVQIISGLKIVSGQYPPSDEYSIDDIRESGAYFFIDDAERFQYHIIAPASQNNYVKFGPYSLGKLHKDTADLFFTTNGLTNTTNSLSNEISAVSGELQNQINNISGGGGSGDYYPNSNPSGFITGVDLSNYVTKTNGEFINRPTVNGTGVLLSGEAAYFPETIVYTTGDQTISGIKDFTVRPTVNGIGVFLSGEAYPSNNPSGFITGVDLNPYATVTNLNLTGSNLQNQINNLNNTYATDAELSGVNNTLNTKINSLSGAAVLLYGDQTIDGTKTFRNSVYIHDLYVTGTEFIANVENNFIESPYILLNLTGGAVDGGIFFVTGTGLTGINDYGPIIGFDHSKNFKFGIARRSDDLSNLNDIASVQQITFYSGFVDGKYATIINLNNTGINLQTNINTVATNLVTTGSTLNIRINSLSGTLTGSYYPRNNPSGFITGIDLSNYATNLNLQNTGQNLNQKIDNLSGYSTDTFATINNLNLTGSGLQQNINIVSGNLTVTGQNLQSQIDDLSVKSIAYAIALG